MAADFFSALRADGRMCLGFCPILQRITFDYLQKTEFSPKRHKTQVLSPSKRGLHHFSTAPVSAEVAMDAYLAK
jgi:hypothetical protein